MAGNALVWDEPAERFYETGVSQCALYVMGSGGSYGTGVAWNGITGITESPSGAEPTALYADNIKYLNIVSAEDFGATIEAYMYPNEFMECDGTKQVGTGTGMYAGQQPRKTFGLVYKTIVGNATDGNAHGYKLHILYGCQAKPSERSYSTVNESPEAITFSWECSTTPVAVTAVSGIEKTACLTIDSREADSTKLAALEAALYGSDGTSGTTPTLLTPDQVYNKLHGN